MIWITVRREKSRFIPKIFMRQTCQELGIIHSLICSRRIYRIPSMCQALCYTLAHTMVKAAIIPCLDISYSTEERYETNNYTNNYNCLLKEKYWGFLQENLTQLDQCQESEKTSESDFFIVVNTQNNYHFNHLKSYNSMALSAFVILYNHYHYLVLKLVYHLNRNPVPTKLSLSIALQQPLICILSLWICLLWILHMNGILKYVVVCLDSFTQFSRAIPVSVIHSYL